MTDREAKEQITQHAERLRLNGALTLPTAEAGGFSLQRACLASKVLPALHERLGSGAPRPTMRLISPLINQGVLRRSQIKKDMAQIARKQGRAAAEEHLLRLATTDFFKGNP